jgi:hypothetical protein
LACPKSGLKRGVISTHRLVEVLNSLFGMCISTRPGRGIRLFNTAHLTARPQVSNVDPVAWKSITISAPEPLPSHRREWVQTKRSPSTTKMAWSKEKVYVWYVSPCGSHDHDPLRLRFLDVQRRPGFPELVRILPSSRPKCRRSVHVASFHEHTAMLEDLTRASTGSVNTAYTVGGIVAGRSLRKLRGRK